MTEEEYRLAKERNQKRREAREKKRRQSKRLLAGFLALVVLAGACAVVLPRILNRNEGKQQGFYASRFC